jgi:hypothetical protein
MRIEDGSTVRSVGFDLRGTLIAPPRQGNLSRALVKLNVGYPIAPENVLAEAERDSQIIAGREMAEGAIGAVDGALATVLTFGTLLQAAGWPVRGSDLARVMFLVEEEYCSKSVSLVDDLCLEGEVRRLQAGGVRCGVLADGPVYREQRVLSETLPRASSSFDFLYSSSQFGVNKHSREYYVQALNSLTLDIPSGLLVVADRVDKDLTSANGCGCQTILVGESGDSWPTRAPTALDAVRSIR